MIRHLVIAIALLAACVGPPADAASSKGAAAPARRTSAPAKTGTHKPSTARAGTAKASAAKSGTAKSGAAKAVAAKPRPAKADSTARLAGGPRRLEDIHIEGEIPAPQVLFVTARDQRRFTRFHHQRYLRTSLQVGETTQLPTRIAITSHPPATAGAP